jgi:hypothetical protein
MRPLAEQNFVVMDVARRRARNGIIALLLTF